MIPSSIHLETERTRLRKVSLDDIPFVFSASRYPGFCDGMTWSPPDDEEELVAPYERNVATWESGDGYTFTIEARNGRSRLGRIAIRREEGDHWNVGYWTHPEFQGQGFMTEALIAVLEFGFSTLGAEVVEAGSAEWNTPSRRVLEKVGMSFARYVSEGFRKEGAWISEDLFEITRAAWEERTPREIS